MTLPKAEYALTDIYVFQLDKKIPFRPFLVKEEKLFENLKEQSRSESIETLSKCITNSSLGKVDGFTLPIFDLQNIWIQLTKISIILKYIFLSPATITGSMSKLLSNLFKSSEKYFSFQ